MNNLFMSQLSIGEFLSYYNKLNECDLIKIVEDGSLEEVNDEIFRLFFLRSNNTIKFKILENSNLYKRVIDISPSKAGRTIFELVDSIVIEKIIGSEWASLCAKEIFEYCKIVNDKIFDIIIEAMDKENVTFNSEISSIINDYMNNELNYDSYVIDLFNNKVKTGLNPLYLLRTKNEKELFILAKFGLVVKVKDTLNDEIILDDNRSYSYDMLKKINTKQINNIIQVLKEKKIDSDEDILVASLTLYAIFGYDNAYKIVRDYFTYLTPMAIKRIGSDGFKDERREFRLNHQKRFYYYGIEDDTIEAIDKMDIDFFGNFLIFTSDREKYVLMNMIKDRIKDVPLDSKRKIIKEILNEKIKEREDNFKRIYMAALKKRLDAKEERKTISAKEIISLLGNCDYPLTLDKNGRAIVDPQLQSFLLGNLKHDNDALLRIILNGEAWGLNTTIDQVINRFDIFKDIVKKANGTLSLNSILDVIDISKSNLYQLEPDLLDITLETLSKIIKSRTYCFEKEDDIVKKVFELHRKRKKKTSSSIPTIKGRTSEFDYNVVPYDAEYLLRVGVDAGNCMKVGAIGGDFLEYCLTNEQGVIVYLNDNYGNTYICPFVRSGNAIHCNGIDPEPPEEVLDDIMETLMLFGQNICEESVKNNREHFLNIEVVTITDLHIQSYMSQQDFEIYHLDEPIPLNTELYTDYNKPTITNYILFKSKTYDKNYYYLSDDRFWQKRPPVFKYDVLKEKDQERISIIVNSILYSDIDYMPISLEQKELLKKNFQNIDVTNFIYIEGNKDWFVAVDKDGNIISKFLPWDIRARFEYKEALESTYNVFNNILVNKTKKKKRF